MPYWLPGPEATDDQRVSVGVNHIHKVCVRLVKPHIRGVALVTGVNILQKKIKGQTCVLNLIILLSFKPDILPFLKERPRGVETRDPGEVLHLFADKAGDMGAEAEADQVGVVVDGDSHVLIDGTDEGRHLQ